MPRPGFSQEDGSASLFRIEPDGIHAQRVRVDLGASSVSEIQVLEGLNLGDQVETQWRIMTDPTGVDNALCAVDMIVAMESRPSRF